MVICLNTTYQDHHPNHYLPFLENGADVVIWNPTEVTPRKYKGDLLKLLRVLKRDHPQAEIALKTYCANSDPAIGAAADVGFPVHLIVDRGHGNAYKLARSLTFFAGLRLVRRILRKEYDCRGIEKIERVRGKILFLTPRGGDQMMDVRQGNLTRDLAARIGATPCFIPGDHWSKWGVSAYRQAFTFLKSVGVISEERLDEKAYPDPLPPSFFKGKCLPCLIHSSC
ncbi:MAG: hypothetical protein KBC64_06260 [Simkaniaceae bacterium]|nr:hypothetical protein [Simkaniaceae bacterium]